MDDAKARAYVLAKPGAEETYPFGPGTMVAKVVGKMFALFSEDDAPRQISLKVDPQEGELLRGAHPTIVPGYHLNKRHWITAPIDGSLPPDLLTDLIDDSYDLVVASLTKAKRESIRR
jgi:predicted DNA-binding protein (MmcQ/YjbR family)